MGNRIKHLTLGTGTLLALLKGVKRVETDLPRDAILCGPVAAGLGTLSCLVESPSFPEAESGKPYPRVNVRVTDAEPKPQ